MVRFITSTRKTTLESFTSESLLGQSFQRIPRVQPIDLVVALDAKDGLAAVYNPQIEAAAPDDILVFLHDDIALDDWLIVQRLEEALAVYDVVGVAGNMLRQDNQRGWFGTMNEANGAFIALGEPRLAVGVIDKPAVMNCFQHVEVKLLDGLFLAAKASTLQNANIRFDPQFRYHLYDLDFCRQCEQAGVKMGFWPLAMTHASEKGNTDHVWFDASTAYLNKWGS